LKSPRRWTLLLVPHDANSPRSLNVSERAVRWGAYIAAVVGLVAVLGVGIGITSIARRLRGEDDASLRSAVAGLKAQIDTLNGSLDDMDRRDAEIRLLAGLPVDDAYVARHDSLKHRSPFSVLGLSTDVPDIDGMISRAKTLSASFAEVSDSLRHNADKFASIPSIMPTAGWLSSAFSRSRFHPILHISRPHEGIDVSAPMGAPIVAPAGGVVTRVTKETGYGLVLEIDHGYGITTKYAHCSRIVVRMGEKVKRGQVIANVGNSGLSTGPHLHYEIHVNGKVVDPLTYVLPSGAIPD
jgi:murein DD-endopeptidase MepM/ murein hydrolase activator NlpD